MKTIAQLIDEAKIKADIWKGYNHTLGDFLDWFYYEKTTAEERLEAVEEEPSFENAYEKWQQAFVAGSVHFICNKMNIQYPDWIRKKKYFLDEPYFAMNAKGDLRIILLMESPFEFRIRQIFVTANALDRV